jgi:hypothetical protein
MILDPPPYSRAPEARMRSLLVLALVFLLVGAATALDTTTRAVGPVHTWSATDLERFDPAWLHVKFVEGSDVELIDSRFLAAGRTDLTAVNDVLDDAISLRRTFAGDRARFQQWKERGERASGQPGPDLSLWFDVELAPDRAGLAATINALNALEDVEIAHPAPVCEPAVVYEPRAVEVPLASDLRTPDYTDLQDYLYDPPIGLNAPAAWAVAGGRGDGMKFIDVELGWTWNHEDFNQLKQFYQGGAGGDDDYIDHGTAVMGEVVGSENEYGVTGFASGARWGTVAITVDEWPDVPQYFLEAAERLDAGDVWLIELQMYPPGRDATPMEWLQVNYDVIWTSSYTFEVVCIEAGANGSQDLDASYWEGVFDRNLRDSGAIMVGAGTPTGRSAEWFTNYGSRMDVHAWGSEIVTTGYGDLQNGDPQEQYTAGFGGTSGASPMITGSALCLQGIAKQALGAPLTPIELRTLLNTTGIPENGTQQIGPRPDLGAAVAQLVDITPVAGSTLPSGLNLVSALSPFSGETVVRFQQPQGGAVSLDVYDVAGRHVRSLKATADAGANSLRWDGRHADGRVAGSGVYLFRLRSGREMVTGRLVKVR